MQHATPPFDIEPSWNAVLAEELQKPYLQDLARFIESERNRGLPVYPPKDLVFNAFRMCPYDRVKVLIMGQDPYHGPGQAHGLCFSVPPGIQPPPSLKNIFKELHADLGIKIPTTGCLIPWAKQGVMLLNAALTVRDGEPLSHYGVGWERFTDAVIAKLSEREDPIIFVLWGKFAQEKVAHIRQLHGKSRHFMLTAAHPSPLSARNGFFGCRHFSQINRIFASLGKNPIDWALG